MDLVLSTIQTKKLHRKLKRLIVPGCRTMLTADSENILTNE